MNKPRPHPNENDLENRITNKDLKELKVTNNMHSSFQQLNQLRHSIQEKNIKIQLFLKNKKVLIMNFLSIFLLLLSLRFGFIKIIKIILKN